MPREVTPNRIAIGYFLALGFAAFPLTLGPGYLLQLDMIFAPGASYLEFLIAEKGPLYYGRLPFVALLDLVTLVVADWIVQRALLVAAVTGSGLALYRVTLDLRFPARVFAGTLYAINPYIYIRLLAGQWYLVLAYAALPLAVFSFYGYLRGERDTPTRAIIWTTVVAIFDPHIAVVLSVLGVILLCFVGQVDGRKSLYRGGHFGILAAGVNAYWLLPAGNAAFTGTSPLATVGQEDLIAFSVRGTIENNVPLSVFMLFGFWRDAYTYSFDVLPLAVVLICFSVIVFLVVLGCFARADPLRDAFVVGAVLGGILAIGMSSELTSPVAGVLVDTPIGAGMRETGKFVAMIVIAYAVLGGRGIDAILASYDERSGNLPQIDRHRVVPVILAILLILTPLVYTFPMVVGFGGQFSTSTYPDDWHTATDEMELDGEQRILVLPWHQYLYFEWADGIVANPTPMFFGGEVVSSHDPDLGIGTLATDPTRERVRNILASEDTTEFGQDIAEVGIKYVVLLNVAEYDRFAYLYEHPDMVVVMESESLTVFQNTAFEDAPSPVAWPPDGGELPFLPLASGILLSLGSMVQLGRP